MASKVGEKETASVTNEFAFTPPVEAPVFEPTPEEFEDPLGYIAKIRPIAIKAGICKIKPPADWQPPFAVDVDKFKFTPRIQRLNELEATTRVKLNFIDQIAKFWELQGSSLKIPVIEKKALDLYTLHQLVKEDLDILLERDKVVQEQRWISIAAKMGFPPKRGHALVLKGHYERILYPFDVFNQGKGLTETKKEAASDREEHEYKQHQIPSRQAIEPPKGSAARRSKRGYGGACEEKPDLCELSVDSKELKRLLFYGAGPKMAGFNAKEDKTAQLPTRGKKGKKVNRGGVHVYDPLAKYICQQCSRGDEEASMLLCDGCDDSYHTFCLVPPLNDIPKGDWRCPKCVAEEVSKPLEAFGFEQAQGEYSLQQFCEMADDFKSDYFKMPVHMVPTTQVEKEFWRLLSSIDGNVTVEYGADLHTMDHGSGFPTEASSDATDKYATSKWNLNNLPVLEGSVLGHINADISGMKVPWMYVGMCFSTFCWHNEDHWSYSINYLHWGEPKTWYGVPGSAAEAFEETMRKAAPELFASQPDLLHQLVTIMNPNILMNGGVPVCRTDQHAGEFVITFPRAYHAGFNQGFNFAEAVNFAPADWLAMGRECITHYSNLRRFCVFSHDELVCKMATSPESLDLHVAAATYRDMVEMVESEKKLRKSLLEWGVRSAERKMFELMVDDERQCDACKTTCFLSAVTCDCPTARPSENVRLLACLRHYTSLCSCPATKHTLWYRYTLDELPVMLQELKLKAESFDNWVTSVKDALDFTTPKTLDLAGLKNLLTEAEEKKFPDSELLQALKMSVQEAGKCANVAAQLNSRKLRTRAREQRMEPKFKLTVEELSLFYEEIEELPCIIKDADAVKQLLDKVKEFQSKAATVLATELRADERKDAELRELLDLGQGLDIELSELGAVRDRCQQEEWLKRVADAHEDGTATLEELQEMIASGGALPSHAVIDKALEDLRELVARAEKWQQRAKDCLKNHSDKQLELLEAMAAEADELPVFLPDMATVADLHRKATEWMARAQALQTAAELPDLQTVEALVLRGQAIPVKMPLLTEWELSIRNARAWREKATREFLFRDSPFSLNEVLLPRTDIGVDCIRVKPDPGQSAEDAEIEAIEAIRMKNDRKTAMDGWLETLCLCKKSAKIQKGAMLQCALCLDWFHPACVLTPKEAARDHLRDMMTRAVKFLCPCCQRSRRPRFEKLYDLMLNMQELGVMLPETKALLSLAKRAMSWQDRAREVLSSEALAPIIARLEAREDAASGTRTPPPQGGDPSSDSPVKEHTYSKNGGLSPPGAAATKHCRKSPLVPRNVGFQTPLIVLPSSLKASLERLSLEADVLEVEMEEKKHIWRILQGCESPVDCEEVADLELVAAECQSDRGRELERFRERQRCLKRKGDVADESKSKRPKRDGRGRGRKMKRKVQHKDVEQEEEEECSAQPCLRPEPEPSTAEVDWVQCDGACELWFHLHCVGLNKDDISEEEDYVCPHCTKAERELDLDLDLDSDVEDHYPLLNSRTLLHSTISC